MKNSKEKHITYYTEKKVKKQAKWKIIFKISIKTLPQRLSTVKIKYSNE